MQRQILGLSFALSLLISGANSHATTLLTIVPPISMSFSLKPDQLAALKDLLTTFAATEALSVASDVPAGAHFAFYMRLERGDWLSIAIIQKEIGLPIVVESYTSTGNLAEIVQINEGLRYELNSQMARPCHRV